MVSTTSTNVRTAVYFKNSVLSIQSIDYAYDYPATVLSKDTRSTRCIVTADTLQPNEAAIYADLCNALKIQPDNYGTVSYDENNAFSFFSFPMIGLKDGKPVLMVGADVGKEWHSAQVPLVRDGDSYKLGNLKASLVGIKTEKTTIPYIVIKTKNYVFHINLKTDKETTFDHVDHAWDSGEIELYLNPLSKSLVKFSNMFKPLFDNGIFPPTGVLLVLHRGKIKQPPPDKNWEVSSQWVIESYPPEFSDLSVQDKDGNITELSNCGVIFVPAGSGVTKSLISKGENGMQRIYVYISGKHSSGNTHWMPAHTSASQPARLPINVQNTFRGQLMALLRMDQKAEDAVKPLDSGLETPTIDVKADSGESVPEHPELPY